MNVVFLVTDAMGGYGGIAKFNRDFIEALETYNGIKKITLFPCFLPLRTNLKLKTSKVDYVEMASKGKLNYILAVLKFCFKPKPAREVDAILCGHIHLLPAAVLIHWFTRANIHLTLHGLEAWHPPKIGAVISRFLLKKVRGFISVSYFTRDKFIEWTGLNPCEISILPNSVDLGRFFPGPPHEGLLRKHCLEGKKILLTVGRLEGREKFKGFDQIIEILPSLSLKIPDLVYMIVGDGTDRERLEKKAEELGVQKQVIFAGYVEEAEKADYYRLADLYVMPSKVEGFGIVYLEALACGIPVIGSKADASREVLQEGGWGVLVDPDNLKELENVILRSLDKKRGMVPDGLSRYSRFVFQKTCHTLFDRIQKDIADTVKT